MNTTFNGRKVLEAETEVGTGPVEEAKTERAKIANRLWIDGNGKEVDQPEQATGVLYEFLGRTKDGIVVPADGKTFSIQFADLTPAALNMLAGFGAHTLMGNVTNTWLGEKGEKADTAHDAIADRFQRLNNGEWMDRTGGGGVGVKIDKDALAEAICQVLVAAGTWTQQAVDDGKKAAVREGLEDAAKVKAARQNPAIAAKYAELVGRATKSESDVAGMFA